MYSSPVTFLQLPCSLPVIWSDLPTPVPVTNLSPYTQMAPVTLGQLQPTRVAAANPLAMQQANMPPAGGLGSLAPVLNRTS